MNHNYIFQIPCKDCTRVDTCKYKDEFEHFFNEISTHQIMKDGKLVGFYDIANLNNIRVGCKFLTTPLKIRKATSW